MSSLGLCESLADEGAGGDGEQRRLCLRAFERRQRVAPLFGAHGAAQHGRILISETELFGERLDMCRPLGEYQTVPSTIQRGEDVADDLAVAIGVCHQVPVDGGDPTGR